MLRVSSSCFGYLFKQKEKQSSHGQDKTIFARQFHKIISLNTTKVSELKMKSLSELK